MVNNNKKYGMTLMELLVVIVIIGILITFGMVSIKLMSRDYEQRKLPQGIYKNLKEITAEILVRNPQEKRSGFFDDNGENIQRSFIPGEKQLPAFGGTGNGSFCDAFKKIANPTRDRFSCVQSQNVDGRAQRGGGDIGNEMYIIGLANPPVTCWDGRQCIKVYVSIKQDANDNPMFNIEGSINRDGKMVGVVDHFGFNIYENGDVEPMIESTSGWDGSRITPYGIAADMITVDVIVDSVDDIYRQHQDLLAQVINHAVQDCSNCDVYNRNVGDRPLNFHNSEDLNYFITTGDAKVARNVPSTATNFVIPVMTNDANGTFCEFGMACRVGFEDNDVNLETDENGQIKSQTIAIPDYRQKQMNDANVLLFKVPYRRALAIKNRIEFISFRTHHVDSTSNSVGCGVDTCVQKQNGVDDNERIGCIARRIANLNDEDRFFIRNEGYDLEVINTTNYCANNNGDGSSSNAARKRRICRMVDVSLR